MHIVLTGNTSFKIANFRAGLVRAMISGGHSITVLAPPDEYSETLTGMGCRFVPLYMDRNGMNPISEARLLLSVYLNLRRIRPDFVFSYTIKNNIYSGLACRVLGIPFAPNVTGLGQAFSRRGILNILVRNLYRVAFRKASRVFFQNEHDRAVFLDAKIVHQHRAKLLPGSGVDLTAFSLAPLPDGEQPVRFLLVARMLKDKGVVVFVEAARVVLDKHPEVKFQLLGPIDAGSRTAIEVSEIDAWVAEGVVDYLGSQTDVRPALRQVHCVVLPSYYHEGTPRSLLEAAAIGRPLISTEMPGCRDAVLPGVSGFLVAPRRTDQLAQAMQDFIDLSANERIAMGQAGRRHMEETYNEQIIVDAYFDLVTPEI
jgi:glycosyltransferase involved in cell wall biosynthesis